MVFKVEVIGSGTALQSAERGSSCYLVSIGEERVIFDFGSGSLRQLALRGLAPQRLATLVLSHAHIDHVADLAPLLFARRNPALTDCAALRVIGWPGFLDYYDKLAELYGSWVRDRRELLELAELGGEPQSGAGWRLSSAEVEHIPGAQGLRIEDDEGRSLVYSGDCDFCPAIIELGRRADVLILDCSFPEADKVPGHMSALECGRVAREAEAEILVLSHFYPPCEEVDIKAEAARAFSGSIIAARDGLVVPVGAA